MADKFPNLPGIPVNIIDGNTQPEQAPGGPTVAVIGTATKGPAGVESAVLSGAGSITKYGAIGSLGRGLAEAFQGGANNATGFRILTETGKLEHIGDDSGNAGITVETANRGSDALELFNIIYDQKSDRLRIYEAASGVLVFDKTSDVEAKDLGLLTVSGSAVNDEAAENQVFGSVGKKLPVADAESDQVASLDAGHEIVTLKAGIAGLNLGRLSFVSSASTPIMCQLRSSDGSQLREELVSSVDVVTGTVTLASAIDAAYYDDAADTGLHADAAVFHSVRFVSLSSGVRLDKVVEDRLPVIGENTTAPEILMTPGSDYSGLPKLINANGVAVDKDLAEVEPGKMNLYEALCDSELALESTDIDVLVFMEAYLDDPALDGQITGETKLPSTEAEGLIIVSDVNADAGIDSVSSNTVKNFADRCEFVFADKAERDLAEVKLNAAGRGGSWVVFETPQSATFGEYLKSDEIARVARILNWEATGFETFVVQVTAEDAGAGTLNNDYWEFSDDSTNYYVWYNVDAGGADPNVAGKTGIEVALTAADTALTVANATKTALEAASGNFLVHFDGSDSLTVTMTVAANVTDAADSATPTGFTFTIVSQGNDTKLTLHFDREIGFSLLAAGGQPEANLAPAYKIYNTDLLFFHREKEVLGELNHYWYTSKTCPDGNSYHEVNFAYKLANICNNMTENETTVIGSIGVRPPSNHFNPAAIATWIGASPEYDDDGDVSSNGSGLLGNKFIAGMGLNGLYNDANQFDPGFKATASGELDDSEVLEDSNGFEIDIGKFLSIVATWPAMTNFSDSSGEGYIASGAALYAGLLGGLAPWRGSTAKQIGGRGIRLARRLAKRHLNSLSGSRYILFKEAGGQIVVVDGHSAALPTSDYTRNMTIRLVAEVIRQMRDAGRPFLGDPLSAARKAALETKLKKVLAEIQNLSDGALESFQIGISQSRLDKARGTAKVTLALVVINELRKLTIDVALTL